MRAFPVRMPSGVRYWTVLDEDMAVIAVADAFLRHVRLGRDGAESTTKAYAGGIALFLRWCRRTGREWMAGVEQLGLFIVWLRHAGAQVSGAGAGQGVGEVLAGPGVEPVRRERRINGVQAGLEQGWATGRGITRSVPTAGDDDALREWLGRLLRLSVSPAAARAILDFGATLDVRGMLGKVTSPTLVLHRDRDQWVSPANGRYLAAHIPGAEYLELSGADHWPWFGDAESVLAPIERFLDRISR